MVHRIHEDWDPQRETPVQKDPANTGPAKWEPVDLQEPMFAWPACRRQVPRSEALSAEASDYVYYFCGPECYENWKIEADALISNWDATRYTI
jgi:YHS domain-containing protein